MRDERVFLLMLFVNLLIAVIYFLWYMVFATIFGKKRTKKYKKDNRRTHLLRFVVMLLCPVIGPLLFLLSYLIFKLPFWKKVDLEDVIFSKERVRIQMKADEERERNVIPLEDAIAVNEKTRMRMVMMNVLKGDIQSSLSAISQALEVKDSETSHYAASALSDELNKFRINVQKMYTELQRNPEDKECGEQLLDYINPFLEQQIFTEIEQKRFVHMMAEAADLFYENNKESLTAKRCENICLRFLEIKDFDSTEKWCMRLEELHPQELVAYTCKLKLYFTTRNREAFFETLGALKRADVVIDYETLELIRAFS
ncbi:MAG: hypothetical protein U0O03_15935 [Blautia wexlerae]